MTIPKHERQGFYHEEPGAMKIGGRFQINAAAIVAATSTGPGWAATQTAVGDFLVTFDTLYGEINTASATVEALANNLDLYAQVGTLTAGAAPTIRIMTKTVATEVTPGNLDWVSFEATFRHEDLDAV